MIKFSPSASLSQFILIEIRRQQFKFQKNVLAWNITRGSLRSDLVLKDSVIILYAMLISSLLS